MTTVKKISAILDEFGVGLKIVTYFSEESQFCSGLTER